MKILLISHQLDYSGAPIALLRMAETLIIQRHNVSLAAFLEGPLRGEFEKLGVKPFDPSSARSFDLYFANTCVTVPVAFELADGNDKVVAWIHESRNFFKIYNLDERRFKLENLKCAYFPSFFMIEQYQSLMPDSNLKQLRNLVSMEGTEPNYCSEEYFSVTGTWEQRKNQVALIHLINQTKVDLKLNFIGASIPQNFPDSTHKFVGQVPMIDAKALIAGSRGLISASIDETQNLTAIESIMSHKPVLLSDIAAHRELKTLIPSIVLFDPGAPASFVGGLDEVLTQKSDIELLTRSSAAARQYFGGSAFFKSVKTLIPS